MVGALESPTESGRGSRVSALTSWGHLPFPKLDKGEESCSCRHFGSAWGEWGVWFGTYITEERLRPRIQGSGKNK